MFNSPMVLASIGGALSGGVVTPEVTTMKQTLYTSKDGSYRVRIKRNAEYGEYVAQASHLVNGEWKRLSNQDVFDDDRESIGHTAEAMIRHRDR